MPKIVSSPMNLSLVMSPPADGASPGGAGTTQYAIVFYHDKFDPPEGWTETDEFIPDESDTFEVVVGDLGTWNRRSDKFKIYQMG